MLVKGNIMQSQLFLNGITAKNNGSCVIIHVSRSSSLIRFLGASCRASIIPGNDCVSSVTFSPAQGKSAIVALAVWNREKSPNDWTHAFFLKITWEKNTPWINLDNPWIPPSDRLGQALEWGVAVQICGVTYSSCHTDADSQSAKLRFVPDGNRLCSFLAGDAKAEEVVAAAQAFEEERAWPAKYAELQQKFAEANSQLAHMQSEFARTKTAALNSSKKTLAQMLGLQLCIDEIMRHASRAGFGKRAKTLKRIGEICQSVISSREHVGS